MDFNKICLAHFLLGMHRVEKSTVAEILLSGSATALGLCEKPFKTCGGPTDLTDGQTVGSGTGSQTAFGSQAASLSVTVQQVESALVGFALKVFR